MQAINCRRFVPKRVIKNKDIDFDNLGTDAMLTPEVLEFFALDSTIKASNQVYAVEVGEVRLDEYELALAS